jgi:L-ascorbate metabolism protein UlaG (beta-lactamase superfamily)
VFSQYRLANTFECPEPAMKITQLRNATIIVEMGDQRILVDPMLAAKHSFPPLKWLDGQRLRNPLVDLPSGSDEALASVTHCLITHCQKGHFDHLDRVGKQWLRQTQTPVICTPHDAAYLLQRGLNAQPLAADHAQGVAFFDGRLQTVACRHGLGWVGKFMEHGVGYFITMPNEPSVYLSGDTVLTQNVREFVQKYQPDVSVVPAGGAQFDLGGEIIMGVEDVLAFAQLARGTVVANHLEAISHCGVQRAQLATAGLKAGIAQRLRIPADGETLIF